MHTLKFNATNIRHAPQICGYGTRSRRGPIGLQVPRQPTAVAGKCTTLVRIKCIPNANPAFGGCTRTYPFVTPRTGESADQSAMRSCRAPMKQRAATMTLADAPALSRSSPSMLFSSPIRRRIALPISALMLCETSCTVLLEKLQGLRAHSAAAQVCSWRHLRRTVCRLSA